MKKFVCILIIIFFVVLEIKYSPLQNIIFSSIANRSNYSVSKGKSKVIFPHHGPANIRAGYTRIPKIIAHMERYGWYVSSQSKWSPMLYKLVNLGISPPFERSIFGTSIRDMNNIQIFSSHRPNLIYENYEDIPPILVRMLLFVENKELLEGKGNPVIEWDRLMLNTAQLFLSKFHILKTSGASTLATQTEKFQHSPDGKTKGVKEKAQQMLSASILAYKDISSARRNIILSYINSVPFGSGKNGEIFGFRDALKYYFSTDKIGTPEEIKNALALVVSVRRPSYYLSHPSELSRLANFYAKKMDVVCSDNLKPIPFIFNKNVSKPIISIKRNLMGLMGDSEVYSFGMADVSARSTKDFMLQTKIQNTLSNVIHDASKYKIVGERLLKSNKQSSSLQMSFNLYEVVGNNNLLRLAVDTSNGELSLNDGMKLELGSTAKLRTLITYLEVIEEIHKTKKYYGDALSNWVKEQGDVEVRELLSRAMARKYSGSPAEGFYTGGGIHYFENFEGKFNGKNSVSDGLYKSINLIFIRMMRDVLNYHLASLEINESEYVRQFILYEGIIYLSRFYRKYMGVENKYEKMIESVPHYAFRLAAAFRVVFPKKSFEEFAKAVKDDQKLFKKYSKQNYNWQDLGYITRLHPIELWLVSYLVKHPNASYVELEKEAKEVIVDSYKWIWRADKAKARSRGIYQIAEIKAFEEIHKRWKRVGYSFNKLVPSLATAIGSSGDRPASLSLLMSVIIRGGMMCSERRFDEVRFGVGTPYETNMKFSGRCERVLSKEVSEVVRAGIRGVVEKGTAIRLKGALGDVEIGGKTGTGQNNQHYRRGGVKTLNRTGTFVFHFGGKFYGSFTIFVSGDEAKRYSFTSSLPLKILTILIPYFEKIIKNHKAVVNRL